MQMVQNIRDQLLMWGPNPNFCQSMGPAPHGSTPL